ncbi:MAG: hypothetical protein EKK57_10465, partial [Proteobacteria bacterium]
MIKNRFIFLLLLLGFLFPNAGFAQRVPKVVNLTTNLSVLTPSTINPEVITLGNTTIGVDGRLWTWDASSTKAVNDNFGSETNQVLLWALNPSSTGRWISIPTGNSTADTTDLANSINAVSNNVVSVESNLTIVSNTVVSHTASINTLTLSIQALSSTDTNLAANLQIVSNSVNILSSNINTLSANYNTTSNTVVGHTASISTLQSNLTTVSNNVNTANSNITTVSNNVNTANANINNLNISTSANTASINTLQGNVTIVSNNVNALTVTVNNLASNYNTTSNTVASHTAAIASKVSASPWGSSNQIMVISGTNGAAGWITPTEFTNFVRQAVDAGTGSGGVSTLTFYAPTTYYDYEDGSVNTNDVAIKTQSIQDAINEASQAYNTNTGARATLAFQPGSLHINQLTIMPNVIYKAL